MPTLLEAKEKVRDLSTKALAFVEDANITDYEKKSYLDKVEPEIKEWTEKVQELGRFDDARKSFAAQLAGVDGGASNGDLHEAAQATRYKSIGEQFVNSPQFKSLQGTGFAGSKKSWTTGEVEIKTTLAEGTSAAPGGGFSTVMTPTVLPGIVQTMFQPLTVADLFPSGTTESPLLRYLVEVAVTNAAATVAEGGLKPESAITFSNVDEVLKKIATFLPVTDEMLEDVSQILSYLNARLSLFVKIQEEVQLLRGDGTGTNLVGILNRSGLSPSIVKGSNSANSAGTTSPTADNDMDAIYRMITQVRITSFLEPDSIVIDPLGWQNIVLSKNTQGSYYAGGPFMDQVNPALWGKKVVATTAMPSLTSLVGAFAQGAQVFRKGGLTVEASNSHMDFFQRNKTAIRAEERLLLAVYRPGAFGTVTSL
jgi:HK97 family phage major capsid protein